MRHDLCLGEFFLIIRMYEAASTRNWYHARFPGAHRVFDKARLILRRVLSFHQILWGSKHRGLVLNWFSLYARNPRM